MLPGSAKKWILVCALILGYCADGTTHAFQSLLIQTRQKETSRLSETILSRTLDSSLASSKSTDDRSLPSKRDNRNSFIYSRRRQISKDVVIIGGGLAGLSAALYLSQIDPDRHITILDKDGIDVNNKDVKKKKSSAASFAAAGMLAPNSERLPKGDYLDLCLESKRMFPDFCDLVESLAKESGDEGSPYLPDEDENGLEPWNIGYVSAGGFLAPAFAGDNVATWAPPEDSKSNAKWLDKYQVRELEPNLHPKVVGGWWFPEDSSVDARRLTCSLRAACVGCGVQYLAGPNYEVTSLNLEENKCHGLWLKSGKYVSTKSILVANGAWMRTLLPVPLEPHKGQSLSLRMPKDRPPLLRRVLFAQDSYIVPKADGRIVIGATVEAGSFDQNVTPAGIMHILSYALELLPGLKDLPLEETWAGLRPTTPDKGPILGETPWENLFLAGGYWRNGVLLAPKTGELVASLIAGEPLNEKDRNFLRAFSWDRFTETGKGATLAADARFAASMYPVHTRKSGAGIAASVGTELGSYSSAVSAREERARDRETLWGSEDDDDAFERAASLGMDDVKAFSFDGFESDDDDDHADITTKMSTTSAAKSEKVEKTKNSTWAALLESPPGGQTVPYGGSADAFTVPYSEENNNSNDLKATYEMIQINKGKQSFEMDEDGKEERPDPGFRIYHVEKGTGKVREVPPYTSPGEFLKGIKQSSETKEEEIQETFDGYSTILKAAAEDNDVRETMREARMKNRIGADKVEINIDFTKNETTTSGNAQSDTTQNKSEDLSSVYEKIRQQKKEVTIEMEDSDAAVRPDPGFRIYHIDKETGEHREVPPYTFPGDFLKSIEEEKKKKKLSKSNNNSVIDDEAPDMEPPLSSNKATQEQENDEYDETTFDGYQTIIQANSKKSQSDLLAAMREARRKNRIGQEKVSDSDVAQG